MSIFSVYLSMKSGVYKIVCIPSGKIYVGSSYNIKKRIKTHFYQLSKRKHRNPHLQSAFSLHGETNFSWEVLEYCEVNQLLKCEQIWLDSTQCYNRDIGFNNCIKSDRPLGYKHTEENKAIMSKMKKGLKRSKESIEKGRIANTGKKRTDTQKAQMSECKMGNKNPMFGIKQPPELVKIRMKKMLSMPRWNTGLTAKDDPRINKLRSNLGKTPINAIKCAIVNLETQEKFRADSMKALSVISKISLTTINRLKNGTAGEKTIMKYAYSEE